MQTVNPNLQKRLMEYKAEKKVYGPYGKYLVQKQMDDMNNLNCGPECPYCNQGIDYSQFGTSALHEKELIRQENKKMVARLIKEYNGYISYFRDANRRPLGTVVTYVFDGQQYLGWSKCNMEADRWNKYEGIKQAIKNSATLDSFNLRRGISKNLAKVPDSMKEFVLFMREKSVRYRQRYKKRLKVRLDSYGSFGIG